MVFFIFFANSIEHSCKQIVKSLILSGSALFDFVPKDAMLKWVIIKTSSFPILRVLGGIFHFFTNSLELSCKQTIKSLFRQRIMRCLIGVCTVCLCPIKGL